MATIDVMALGLSRIAPVPEPVTIDIMSLGLSRHAPPPPPPVIDIMAIGLTKGPAPAVDGAIYMSFDDENWVEVEILISSDGVNWDVILTP